MSVQRARVKMPCESGNEEIQTQAQRRYQVIDLHTLTFSELTYCSGIMHLSSAIGLYIVSLGLHAYGSPTGTSQV